MCTCAKPFFFLIPAQNMLDWFGSAILNDLLDFLVKYMAKNSHCLFTCQVQGCCYRFSSISVPSSVPGEKTSIHFLK